MIPKALLKKEWKHTSILIWAISIVFFIQFPVRAVLKIEEWQENKFQLKFQDIYFEMYDAFSGSIFSIFLIGLIAGLTGVLLGRERVSKRNDFSLALPFSRTSMFATKCFLGLSSILIPFSVMYWISYFIIQQSEFAYMLTELNVLETFFAPLLGYFAIVSLFLFVGSFTGDMRSQIAVSSVFILLPPGIFAMVHEFVNIHQLGNLKFTKIMEDLFWPTYILGLDTDVVELLYPLVGGILFLVLGILLFKKAPAEHNGDFLVFNFLKPVFKILIFALSLLFGGLIMTAFIPFGLTVGGKIVAYWLGALVLAGFAWIIMKKYLGLFTE